MVEGGRIEGRTEGRIEGRIEGERRGQIKTILKVLHARFARIPQSIVESLEQRTDAVALDSLAVFAATCSSLDEFADALK
jgi:predicted transposase YdaD